MKEAIVKTRPEVCVKSDMSLSFYDEAVLGRDLNFAKGTVELLLHVGRGGRRVIRVWFVLFVRAGEVGAGRVVPVVVLEWLLALLQLLRDSQLLDRLASGFCHSKLKLITFQSTATTAGASD